MSVHNMVGNPWFKSIHFSERGFPEKVLLEGEDEARDYTIHCSRIVWVVPEKGVVIKLEADGFGGEQTSREGTMYEVLSKEEVVRVPERLGAGEEVTDSGVIWWSVHQYIEIDRSVEATDEELREICEWGSLWSLHDIDPEDRGESTTDGEANVGFDKNGKWWVLDYGF